MQDLVVVKISGIEKDAPCISTIQSFINSAIPPALEIEYQFNTDGAVGKVEIKLPEGSKQETAERIRNTLNGGRFKISDVPVHVS